jgi:hypothetical protein
MLSNTHCHILVIVDKSFYSKYYESFQETSQLLAGTGWPTYTPGRFFLIPFYLQAVQIHSANGVKLLEA